jgi:dUTPase
MEQTSAYTLRIKVNDPSVLEYYQNKMVSNTFAGDSGIDLCIPHDYKFKLGMNRCNLGISCELIDNASGDNFDWMLVARSSISATPLQLHQANHHYLSHYRGEIIASLECYEDRRHKSTTTNYTYDVKAGTRLLQIIAPDLRPIKVIVVDELSENKPHILRIKIDPQHLTNTKFVEYYKNIAAVCSGEYNSINMMVPTEYYMQENTVTKCGLGVSCEMIHGTTGKNIGYYMHQYAYLSQLSLANGVGIIDAGYRGELLAMIRSVITHPLDQSFLKLCTPDQNTMIVQVVDELSSSERGVNGLGSTGK